MGINIFHPIVIKGQTKFNYYTELSSIDINSLTLNQVVNEIDPIRFKFKVFFLWGANRRLSMNSDNHKKSDYKITRNLNL